MGEIIAYLYRNDPVIKGKLICRGWGGILEVTSLIMRAGGGAGLIVKGARQSIWPQVHAR